VKKKRTGRGGELSLYVGENRKACQEVRKKSKGGVPEKTPVPYSEKIVVALGERGGSLRRN